MNPTIYFPYQRVLVGSADITLDWIPNPVSKPDVLIRKLSETTFTGDNIYSDGNDQSLIQTVPTGITLKYVVKVQHDGEGADSYRLTAGVLNAAGWGIKIFDAASGGNDITSPDTRRGMGHRTVCPRSGEGAPAGTHRHHRVRARHCR